LELSTAGRAVLQPAAAAEPLNTPICKKRLRFISPPPLRYSEKILSITVEEEARVQRTEHSNM